MTHHAKVFRRVTALMFLSGALASACGKDEECAVDCATPPAGCTWQGQLSSGDCDQVTCGTLVCEDGGADSGSSNEGRD